MNRGNLWLSLKHMRCEEEIVKLNHHGIPIIETAVAEIENENGQIKNVIFKDGSKMPLKGMYAAIPFVQSSDIPFSLGCEITEQGYIKIDAFQKTTTYGVFACGDNSVMMRSVANAVYGGNFTGAVVNKELTEEQF